ncbi:MAG TPA: BTAD domain-containing putative transcriptional regulator [Streptosporangiaceae bacterium]|nr:BTAD domain-containing putative transcriptional regulator [Streptosporangiaceae bacterium]
MTRIDFRVVGEFQLLANEATVPLGSPRRRALLAVLVACANETVLAPSLLAELWPADPPPNALANLRTYASELRRQLPPEISSRITTSNGGYRLRLEPGELDIWVLRQHYETARSALDRGDAAAAVALLEPVHAKLTHGGVFPGVAAGPILDAARTGIADECRNALEAYFEACIMAGSPADVISALRAHVHRHPLGEHGYVLLMAALSQAGQNAAALDAFQQARRLLIDELGIEPGAELQEMQQSVLRGDFRPAAVRGSALRPAGHPSVLFRPFQLPPDVPDFAGRREAVKRVSELLSGGSPGAWPAIASVTGMPGTGKSTLAVHVAHQLREEFGDGQIYLDLGGDDLGAVDPHDALGQVLTGLGLTAESIPATSGERAAMLRSLCADRRFLLVLDNVSAAGQVLPLIPAGSGCGLLVTSRGGLPELQSWPQVELAPLGLREGVELLSRIVGTDRVQADMQAATRVVELCAGLPLAIRIAGTRLASRRHQSISWLAGRLDDERTRLDELAVTGVALRSSFDLAYRSLDASLQRGLRILGMLELPDFGAWTAAAALASSIRESEDVIDGLVQARLLAVASGRALDVPRFRFHQLVRLYVRDVSAADSPDLIAAAVSRAYSACLAAAAGMDQRLRSHLPVVTSDRAQLSACLLPGQAEPAAWFATEQAALVAVVHGAAARGWHDLTWDLALTLQRFLESQHHFRDWQDVATAGLGAARASGNRLAEGALLCSLGELSLVRDEPDSAAGAFGEALDLLRGTNAGERRARARALLGMSIVHAVRGRLEESAGSARTSIKIVDERLDPGIAAEAWMGLGATQHLQGKFGAATASFEHALAGFISTGDRMNQAILLVNMGTTHAAAGRPAEAERCLRQSALICEQIGFRNGEGFAYTALGTMLLRRGDADGAERALLTALEIVRERADNYTESIIMVRLGEIYQASDLSRSREHFSRAVALLSAGQLPVMLADSLAGLGQTESLAGRHDAAREAWTRAIALLEPVDADRASGLKARLAGLVARPETGRATRGAD